MHAVIAADSLGPGFADPVLDAQRVFRSVLQAMAQPGTVQDLPVSLAPPAPLTPAAGAVLLALTDFETPVWLDAPARGAEVSAWLRFHTGAPMVESPADAAFALVSEADALPPFAAFNSGTDESPESATTVVIQTPALTTGAGASLAGPGIPGRRHLDVAGVPADFWDRVRGNARLFPRGLDLILAAERQVAALPRTVQVEG